MLIEPFGIFIHLDIKAFYTSISVGDAQIQDELMELKMKPGGEIGLRGNKIRYFPYHICMYA